MLLHSVTYKYINCYFESIKVIICIEIDLDYFQNSATGENFNVHISLLLHWKAKVL